jgi:hypothetical protein
VRGVWVHPSPFRPLQLFVTYWNRTGNLRKAKQFWRVRSELVLDLASGAMSCHIRAALRSGAVSCHIRAALRSGAVSCHIRTALRSGAVSCHIRAALRSGAVSCHIRTALRVALCPATFAPHYEWRCVLPHSRRITTRETDQALGVFWVISAILNLRIWLFSASHYSQLFMPDVFFFKRRHQCACQYEWLFWAVSVGSTAKLKWILSLRLTCGSDTGPVGGVACDGHAHVRAWARLFIFMHILRVHKY